MFTLVYHNGNLNRPETLSSFLQSNVGNTPLLQVDCITPYEGGENELIKKVCDHLNSIDPHIEVEYNVTQTVSVEFKESEILVHYMAIRVLVTKIKNEVIG